MRLPVVEFGQERVQVSPRKGPDRRGEGLAALDLQRGTELTITSGDPRNQQAFPSVQR